MGWPVDLVDTQFLEVEPYCMPQELKLLLAKTALIQQHEELLCTEDFEQYR